LSLTMRGAHPMLAPPAVLTLGMPVAVFYASSTTHDTALAIIGAVSAAGVALGLKWLQWSIRRGVRDVVDEEVRKALDERDHRP
jgi:hypothetical protein